MRCGRAQQLVNAGEKLGLMSGAVPCLAQRVEKVRDLLWDDLLVGEPPQRLVEGPLSFVDSVLRCDQLGE